MTKVCTLKSRESPALVSDRFLLAAKTRVLIKDPQRHLPDAYLEHGDGPLDALVFRGAPGAAPWLVLPQKSYRGLPLTQWLRWRDNENETVDISRRNGNAWENFDDSEL